MQKTMKRRLGREVVFAGEYRGLQQKISVLTGEPQPPCFFCTDQQIWNCSKTGRECCAFSKYYSSYDQ